MHAQVIQESVGDQLGAGKLSGHIGDENLATMRNPHKAGGSVDLVAEVVVGSRHSVAGVHTHPHREWAEARPVVGGKALLCLDSSLQGLPCIAKGSEDTIAGLFHEPAIVPGDRRLEQLVVPSDRVLHGIGIGFPSPRASLDIGEEERQGAGSALHHGSNLLGVAAKTRLPGMLAVAQHSRPRCVGSDPHRTTPASGPSQR